MVSDDILPGFPSTLSLGYDLCFKRSGVCSTVRADRFSVYLLIPII